MTYSVHTTIFRQLGMDLPAAITTKQPNPQTFFLRWGTDTLARNVQMDGLEPT